MDCHEIKDEIGAYVFEPPPPAVDEHLRRCPDCRELLARLRQAYGELAELLPDPDQDLISATRRAATEQLARATAQRRNRRLRNVALVALPIAAAVVLGIALVLSSTPPEPETAPRAPTNRTVTQPGSLTWLSPAAIDAIRAGTPAELPEAWSGRPGHRRTANLSWLSPTSLQLIGGEAAPR